MGAGEITIGSRSHVECSKDDFKKKYKEKLETTDNTGEFIFVRKWLLQLVNYCKAVRGLRNIKNTIKKSQITNS
jgi:hypothetical protein